ncbi:MAG: DNAse/DNA nickase [Candidatus Alkanophagales archaeon MCA70_species_1]|nr:DNAse/DNA nickase [Candidatus Alkanophaga volatiphilum]
MAFIEKGIEATEVKLQLLLSNAQEAYKVPLYQRPYAWSRDQWEDLFEDLNSLRPNDVHFLGSIVVVPESEHRFGVNYFQVVDGQQRLATILIWLSAIRDIAKENGNNELANYLTETFLFARELESGRQRKIPKLQLGQLDNDAFRRVLEGKSKDYNHLIFECYKYFKNKTNNEKMWQILLNNVSIIHINASNHFNAFRLFETLNDRGLELSAADLIKNFLLMKVSSKEEIFNDTISQWNEMYEKVRDKEPVKFIRRYMLSNYKGRISESRLYEEVRKKLENKNPEKIYDFVKDLNDNAIVYKKIFECSFSQDKINKKLEELHLVEVAPSFTLLLKIMPHLGNKKISKEDVLEIMEMIESFHIRWGVCGQSTSRLDKIYNDICIELKDKQPQEFKEIIKNKLLQEIKNNADDEIFRRNFSQRAFKPNETRTKYILWKLSKPTGETALNIREIQTEHVMPQTLSDEWIEYLKRKTSKTEEEIRALHRENLNRIGNLTIIKGEWNISMSNRLFSEKKEDYRKSEFQITKELSNHDEWTFKKIDKRSKQLAEEACKIWSLKEN